MWLPSILQPAISFVLPFGILYLGRSVMNPAQHLAASNSSFMLAAYLSHRLCQFSVVAREMAFTS
jgi:hypothetical protein